MTVGENNQISVLVVEDSPTQREVLVFVLEAAGGFKVVGTAKDGLQAIEKAESLKPDMIVMDCHMPNLNGFEATRQIMERAPTRVIMVSSTLASDEVEHTFNAVKHGALAFLVKPTSPDSTGNIEGADELIMTLRLMSEVRVVRRHASESTKIDPKIPVRLGRTPGFIAIGGSTGAPAILAQVIASAANNATAPILIVQHMAAGFVAGFADWLTKNTGMTVLVAQNGMIPEKGKAYIAPDGKQMAVNAQGSIVLNDDPPDEGFRPSVNYLFRSLANHHGQWTVGILLTGMGRDGAEGLKALRDNGARTIAQDEASCVVFGMPREAIALGAVELILSPQEVGAVISGEANSVGKQG